MKFTTLISSTTPFINLLVALLLHNPSSSIVAANEDVFSFSTASSTTDNKNAEESVIDFNPRRSLGKGSDKKDLSDLMPDKVDEYLNQALLDNLYCHLQGSVRWFVNYVLEPEGVVGYVESEGYFGFAKVRNTLPSELVTSLDVLSPDADIHEKCEDYEFGLEGNFTEDICAARDKVVAMSEKESTCDETTFDDIFRIRAAKSSYLSNPTTAGRVICARTTGNLTSKCANYVHPSKDDALYANITLKVSQLSYLVNNCLPEGFNNPLLSSGAIYIQSTSSRDGNPVFSISDGWLSSYKQVTDSIDTNKTFMNLLIKNTVMRFFAIYWINKKNGPSEFMGLNVDTKVSLRRQFENVAMTSYFMEKHSKDILTQEEKKDLFKFTDFEQYIVCASHLGAKLAHEECDTDDAFKKLQKIAKKIPEYEEKDKEGNPRVTSSDPICKVYFEKKRKNWRNYAKEVMDKTMTSKCDKKAGKSCKAEKKAGKRLRKD